MKIGIIDPAKFTHEAPSPNIGDHVISRAVHRELKNVFGEETEFFSAASHQYPSRQIVKELSKCDRIVVGGSNLLWFRLARPQSWKIGPWGTLGYRNLILFGVGWGAYEIPPNLYGKIICSTILDRNRIHSVRDGFTANVAGKGLGISSVLNTACPTMWCLKDSLLQAIHHKRGDECIFALTDYAKDPVTDGQLIKALKVTYGSKLLFWPQGKGDLRYARSLGYDGRAIDENLEALLNALNSGTQFDYIGTRLHAGVLCLEHRVRTLIIAIDNRATEIGKDTGLPIVSRGNTEAINQWLGESRPVQLKLPSDNINRWKKSILS